MPNQRKNTKSEPEPPAIAAMLKHAADVCSQPLFLIDRTHRIILANNVAQKTTTFDEANLLGQRIETILSLENPQTHAKLHPLKLTSNETLILDAKIHGILYSVTFLPLHYLPHFTAYKPRPTALAILTPQSSTQADAHTASSIYLTILGQLTMRVAHDFSNSLTSILGNAELLEEQLITLLKPPVPEHLTTLLETGLPEIQDVVRKCREMANFVDTLKEYARQQPTNAHTVDLNTAITETITMARSLLGRKIQIGFHPAEDLPHIYIDRLRFDQILLSILVHIKNTMPAGGRVTIETEEALLDSLFVQKHPGSRQGRYSKLSITDSSAGIGPNTLEHIFDFPKSDHLPDTASLGLPTCYAILKQFGGYINIESWIDKGTRFDIYFPQTPQETSRIETPTSDDDGVIILNLPSSSSAQIPAPNSLIVIAEDDPDILRFVNRNLTKAGFETVTTNNGKDALNLYRELTKNAKQPALLIADLGLPAMDGRTLCNTIRKEFPNAAVLLTSGYRVDINPSTHKTEEGYDFLQKPFPPLTLLSTIKTILSKATP